MVLDYSGLVPSAVGCGRRAQKANDRLRLTGSPDLQMPSQPPMSNRLLVVVPTESRHPYRAGYVEQQAPRVSTLMPDQACFQILD